MLSATAVALFLTSRRAKGSRPATLDFYERELARLTRRFPELPTDPGDLEAIWAGVIGAEATRHGCFRGLRALYRWLYRRGHISDNPMSRADAPILHQIRQRTLDRADVDHLLDSAELSLRDRTILTLILDSGVRSGEARSLLGRDLRDGWIAVRGKVGQRQVWVHGETMTRLRQLARGPDEAVLRTFDGRPLTRNRLYRIVAKALAREGLAAGGKHGPHLLRHTMGRDWIVAGGSLPGLREMLGHQAISTTAIYATLAPMDVRAEHDRIGRFAGEDAVRRVK